MTTTGAEDRLNLLLNQGVLTGIDFVYVYPSQDRLDVYFLRPPETLNMPLPGTITAGDVTIANIRDAGTPHVTIQTLGWAVVDGRTVLRLDVVRPDSFALHRLTIRDARIDPFFSHKDFSFQADCDTGLDCEPDAPPPFPETYVDFNVDYTARDFQSFRRALLDYAAQRYPRWLDRLEADVGVMLVEVMSALGDEMAYTQDRIAREAYLDTASQRFSLRQLARLVDYEPFDGQAASVWIDVTCNPGENGVIEPGTPITDARGDYIYEIGTGLFDASGGYEVDSARNRFTPYYHDEDDLIVPAFSTSVNVAGHVAAALPPITDGRLILLMTNPLDSSDPAARLFVRLLETEELTDPLTGDDYTRLTWDTPTPYPLDKLSLEVRGNIVPATAGATRTFTFGVGNVISSIAPETRAIVRRGANGKPVYRVSLPDSADFTLSRLYDDENGMLRAEIRLFRAQEIVTMAGGVEERLWEIDAADEWEWRSSLIGTASSTPFDSHFTLDDGVWDRLVGYPTPGNEYVFRDYKASAGFTMRFGDGEFGRTPPSGAVFTAVYRLDSNAVNAGNLPREVLSTLPNPPSFVESATNPAASLGDAQPESALSIRQNAPQAFREDLLRAVKPDDYAVAAEKLSWVQNAGATMRWTGSWRTIFVAADPLGAVEITPEQRIELDEQIDRYRQAGQDARSRPPRYADLDFEVFVCAEFTSYAGAVKEAVIDALTGVGGFFSADNFTFGTRLYRGALEAAIGSVQGVRAVEQIRYRRRGHFDWRTFGANEDFYDPGLDAIIRVENDLVYPERGTLRVVVSGGA